MVIGGLAPAIWGVRRKLMANDKWQTKSKMLLGLHHVTALAGDAQDTLDHYTQVLKLRLVKRTVNFDDPARTTSISAIITDRRERS